VEGIATVFFLVLNGDQLVFGSTRDGELSPFWVSGLVLIVRSVP
jgi:hypothetical protein